VEITTIDVFVFDTFALSIAESDEFTRNLLNILRSTQSHTIQPIQCAIMRSDYMLHQPGKLVIVCFIVFVLFLGFVCFTLLLGDESPQIKQVEINTIRFD
jgi:hypothetical protein